MPRLDSPPHPAVDWSKSRMGTRIREVLVMYPACGCERWAAAATVRRRIHAGEFVARCQDCNKPPRRLHAEVPNYPAVARDLVRGNDGRLLARVTCPACGRARLTGLGPLIARVSAGTFTALCARDNAAAIRARPRRQDATKR